MTIHIVLGPPCAGKSTHVADNANEGDVIIDYDTIASALGSRQKHNATGAIKELAFTARQAVIAKTLQGIDADAWIIHTAPTSDQVDAYKTAGAEFTLVDPGETTCITRAAADQRPERTIEDIKAWYTRPPTDAIKSATPSQGTTSAYQTLLNAYR